MRRGGPLRRRTKLKSKRQSRFPHRRCPEYIEWLKDQRCCITHRYGVDPAHVKTRGSGGDDLYNCVPMVHSLHDELGRIGIKTFQRKYAIDLSAVASHFTERFFSERSNTFTPTTDFPAGQADADAFTDGPS